MKYKYIPAHGLSSLRSYWHVLQRRCQPTPSPIHICMFTASVPTVANAGGFWNIATRTFVCQPGVPFVYYVSLHQDYMLYLTKAQLMAQSDHQPHAHGNNSIRTALLKWPFNDFGVPKAHRSGKLFAQKRYLWRITGLLQWLCFCSNSQKMMKRNRISTKYTDFSTLL